MRYLVCFVLFALQGVAAEPVLYSTEFNKTALGRVPDGWVDLIDYRPSPNWAVDGKGFLRIMMKEYVGFPVDGDRKRRLDYVSRNGLKYSVGLLVYDGALADGSKASALANVRVSTTFKKTNDQNVFFGLVLRTKDRENYYAARVGSGDKLEIIKVSGNAETVLASLISRDRMGSAAWTMTFEANGDLLTARLIDEKGVEQSRVDAKDGEYSSGAAGLTGTTFAAAAGYTIYAEKPFTVKMTPEQIATANRREGFAYAVVPAASDPAALNTSFDDVAADYDVIVAGGGTGGMGAALQAARMGAKVLLLEETDFIGGQMANAGVTSMDEGGIWGKNPVRERGIYREFHESAVNHYYTIEKDPFTAYHFNLQSEGGFEPGAARAVLYGLIEETRRRPDTKLDLAVRTKVVEVQKTGNTVNGVTLEEWTEAGPKRKNVKSGVLIDATEYGDVIPLTGARYRVGTTTSDNLDPASPVQDHTWLGVIREYPEGLPEELKIKEPPPGYEERIGKLFKNYQLYGNAAWGGEHRGTKGPRLWWVYAAWRGMPDSTSTATGEMTEERHTKCGLNGGNDYKVSAATMENPQQRMKDELAGINLTLSIIYWFQKEMGLNWSVAREEGYGTPYNIQRMKERGVRPDLLPIASQFPQWPYVREARRIIGVETLRGQDLYTRDRGEDVARHWASTVAINDYSFDLHGTGDSLEADLDEHDYINATGPFPVPFGVFIPEKVDGFVPAEKNFSQSRLANGATRLQPSTMLDGQAAGAIAALAVQKKVQPRELNIIDVQSALLASGDTLMSRWYEDVPYGSPLWQATQLLSLYGMMDRPGAMPKSGPLAEGISWGAKEKVAAGDVKKTLAQLAKIIPDKNAIPAGLEGKAMSREEFALLAADLLRTHGRYLVTEPSPYAPKHDFEQARKAMLKKKAKTEKKE